MDYRRNSDVLLETLNAAGTLAGMRVLDVGSGDGALSRLMAKAGAHVTGVECSPRQLAKARAAETVADETFVEGVAQSLPALDGSVDAVVFFNSLHHVPVDAQAQGLAEAARVLKPGGMVYVSEPVAEGAFFDLVRPIDDETEVRAAAYAQLGQAASLGLHPEAEFFYIHIVRQNDYEAFRDRIISANAEREARFAELDAPMREAFTRLGKAAPDGAMTFEQKMRVNLLRKTA